MAKFKRMKQQDIIAGSVYEKTSVERIAFLKKVYLTFAIALATASIGAFVVMKSQSLSRIFYQNHFLFTILIFALLGGTYFARKHTPINYILFLSFTTVMGMSLGPLMFAFLQSGNFDLVIQALGLTTLAFAGLTVYAWTTKKDFNYLGGFLFMGLFLLIGAIIINIFLKSSIITVAISGIGVLLFSMFILYDTQNIMKRYDETEYISGAIDLFLDFLNLFLFILQLLASLRE